MALYDKAFPYILKYKGFSFRVNRVAAGSGFNTTIEKETGVGTGVYGAAVTFTADTDKTPAYLKFIIGTTGSIGDPSAQTSGTEIDDDLLSMFVMQEGELDWGKQVMQNMLHLVEQMDAVNSGQLNTIDDATYWLLKN